MKVKWLKVFLKPRGGIVEGAIVECKIVKVKIVEGEIVEGVLEATGRCS